MRGVWKTVHRWLLGLGLGILVAHTPAHASGIFLFATNFNGSVTTPPYENWVALRFFDFAATKPATNAFPHHALALGKNLDDASLPMLNLLKSGQRVGTLRLEFTKPADAGQIRYYQITLTNAYFRAYSFGGDSDDQPLETWTLDYESMAVIYTQLTPANQVVTNSGIYWNLPQNSGGFLPNPQAADFRVTSIYLNPFTVQLTWTSKTNKTYLVRASSQINGPYQTIKTVPTAGAGETTTTLDRIPANQFFRIEEQ